MSENELEIKRCREIIHNLKRRLHELEKQQAIEGSNTKPEIFTEIEDLKERIKRKESDVERLLSLDNSTKSVQVESFKSPIAKYDIFLQRLFENLTHSQYDKHPTISKFLTSLKYALMAEDIFLAGYFGTSWDVQIARNDDALERVKRLLQKDDQLLNNGLDQAHRYFRETKVADEKIYTNVMFARLQPDNSICVFVTLPKTELRKILVIHNISSNVELDFGFSVIINAILKVTDNLSNLVSAVDIETEIHNALKLYFGYVSDYLYNRQFEIFNKRLQHMTVFFEPIIALSQAPFIARWEALARDPTKDPKCAPSDLFKIAELWGRKFQLELDMHFLDIAVRKHGAISKSENNTLRKYVARRGELAPLHVNVYPVSLLRRAYRDTIKVIEQETKFPISKLVLEISEKLPLPQPDDTNLAVDEIRWFREQLSYYTDRGISFAIDDFGVGFASTSRLSRMEPEFVKIDRDALLHQFGGFTLEYVQKLVRESFGKMKMVVEGFDDQSRLSLAQLHELNVRYVQGHFFGAAQDSVYRLSQEDEDRIAQSLGL